jgi:hypothetical protein
MNTDELIKMIDRADEIERECAAEVSRILGEAIASLDAIIKDRGL